MSLSRQPDSLVLFVLPARKPALTNPSQRHQNRRRDRICALVAVGGCAAVPSGRPLSLARASHPGTRPIQSRRPGTPCTWQVPDEIVGRAGSAAVGCDGVNRLAGTSRDGRACPPSCSRAGTPPLRHNDVPASDRGSEDRARMPLRCQRPSRWGRTPRLSLPAQWTLCPRRMRLAVTTGPDLCRVRARRASSTETIHRRLPGNRTQGA